MKRPTTNEPRDEDMTTKSSGRKVGDAGMEDDGGRGDFEDPFGDDVDSEDERMISQQNKEANNDNDDDDDAAADVEMDDQVGELPKQFFRMGVDALGDGEQLEHDPSAYLLYHRFQFGWPCMSFDFVPDKLGAARTKLPLTCFLVAGTQADSANNNRLEIVKLADLRKTQVRDEDEGVNLEDGADDDDDDLDDDPIMTHHSIKHTGAVNRVRVMPQAPRIAASWSDNGRVYVWDIATHLNALGYDGDRTASGESNIGGSTGIQDKPMFSFRGHGTEGYAMDWSPVTAGRFATGDCKNAIYVWTVTATGQCQVDDSPLRGHTDSVEDLQWSPTEGSVFASASVDQTVKVWDVRSKNAAMLSVHAHDSDVNVISWSPTMSYLLASGSDEGAFRVWDLRKLTPGAAPTNNSNTSTAKVGDYRWHKAPVTGIEWSPTDESVIAVNCADNSTSVWDLALEEDAEHANATAGLSHEVMGSDNKGVEIPPQLLFMHQGQNDPKEVHFHRQIPGLIASTAADGFDVFVCEPLDPRAAAP